jgi:uncharacterized protein (DUF934 family)
MPRLIKNGTIIQEDALDALNLEQWLTEDSKAQAVYLEPGEAPLPLFDHLGEIPVIAINFPAFMDGRGFSYARELRERGYSGELRATGHFIRDQLAYLARCGFDAFQMEDEAQLDDALASLGDFSEAYQAAADQPLPLFRRRAQGA